MYENKNNRKPEEVWMEQQQEKEFRLSSNQEDLINMTWRD